MGISNTLHMCRGGGALKGCIWLDLAVASLTSRRPGRKSSALALGQTLEPAHPSAIFRLSMRPTRFGPRHLPKLLHAQKGAHVSKDEFLKLCAVVIVVTFCLPFFPSDRSDAGNQTRRAQQLLHGDAWQCSVAVARREGRKLQGGQRGRLPYA